MAFILEAQVLVFLISCINPEQRYGPLMFAPCFKRRLPPWGKTTIAQNLKQRIIKISGTFTLLHKKKAEKRLKEGRTG